MMIFAIVATLASCEVEEFSDLNNAEVDAFGQNLTRGDLQDLIGGILYSSRVRLGNYFDDHGIIGREYYRFSSSDPRFTGDLLGGGTNVLDNNTFYITGPWAARYRTIKNANLILGFLDSQDLSAQFSQAEITATQGFLKSFIAYELLLNLNLTDENGIRIDVADENNLGPFVSKTEALAAIQNMLVDGGSDLANGSDAFPFTLSAGFSGFATPSGFLQVNKAISARVALYQEDDSAALAFLEDSFLNLSASDLDTGVYYTFSEDQTDIINPLFISIGGSSSAQARVVEPSFIADAIDGDMRLNKIVQLDEVITLDNLSGDNIVFRYTENDASIPIIRNEELILIYAEANININPSATVSAINLVRSAAGVGPYTGPTDPESLVDEVLFQRRYSLFAEGHRWIDVRRYDRLDELPLARPDDDVWSQFPIPLNENQ